MQATKYLGSKQWRLDSQSAQAHFRVTFEQVLAFGDCKLHPRSAFVGPCRYVRAVADTGSMFEVVLIPMGVVASKFLGASVLVAVVSPWNICYGLQTTGVLHWSYVAEKFIPKGVEHIHAGDAAALTLTIAHALGRPFELPHEGATDDDS